jgi:hypothetical protein
MEYASSKAVSLSQLLAFLDAIQQHHTIGDIPVVSYSTLVRRSEYLTVLYKIFDTPSSSYTSKDIFSS